LAEAGVPLTDPKYMISLLDEYHEGDYSHVETMRVLLDHGGNPNVMGSWDAEQMSALKFVLGYGFYFLANLLIDYGATTQGLFEGTDVITSDPNAVDLLRRRSLWPR